MKNIAILGSAGAIGSAFVSQLSLAHHSATIHSFARTPSTLANTNIVSHTIDYENESSIQSAAVLASADGGLDLVIVSTGILHDQGIMPEKSLRELSADKFQHLFWVNTIVPALIAKHFIPHLNKDSRSIFAALSARIGSISDNHLGGWYAYRASKAALNMVIKTAAIESARNNEQVIIVGLHPGTVDSALSKPFQHHIPKSQLFTPEYSVSQMQKVLNELTFADTGKCFAFDGKVIDP